jgi:hypothetical protein
MSTNKVNAFGGEKGKEIVLIERVQLTQEFEEMLQSWSQWMKKS